MPDTQSLTSLTVEDATEESCLLVTGSNLRSNKNEPLGDNDAQQAPSTPKGKRPKAKALGTKSKKLKAKAPRTQTKEAWTEPPRTQSAKMAAERCPKGHNNIKRWHKSFERILCYNKVYVPGVENA